MAARDMVMPDALGVPGAKANEPPPPDPVLKYLADGSFYVAVAAILLPILSAILLGMLRVEPVLWGVALFMVLAPAAMVLGVLAQTRPGVRWRNGTAWLGIMLGLLETLVYVVIVGAWSGFLLMGTPAPPGVSPTS